ncbi:MAG: metallophosphoesterase [Campylobacterales bacterium]|nr:metallophosphoesterase [Campylobacterales bacterium]
MNPSLFFVAFLGVFILLNMYISKRFIEHLTLSNKSKLYFRIFLIVNLLGIVGYVLGRYYVDIPNWLYFLFSIPIGVLFLLFCTAIIYDISRLSLNTLPLSQTRRNFFKRTLDISSLTIASGISAKAMLEARFIEIENVDIFINKLKKEYTLVQLSDVHIGGLIDKEFIEEMVERVNKLQADLVVITGDLVDMDITKIKEPLFALTQLQSKYGTYFIPGNHEYFHNLPEIINELKRLGIIVLENNNLYIGDKDEGFNLAGVYDIFGYRAGHHFPELKDALKGVKNAPTILLAHQPKYIEEVDRGVDLILSGHTHGGQLYPFKFLVGLQQPYISGLHQHNEDLQIYVSKGTGFWGPPMRLGASSEITFIRLLPA